jgi:(1->4)-alpha-D-glucan 1-alpha-D-glucosylmutase
LTLDFPGNFPEEKKQNWLRFVMRWQQFTGPIMAKGQEDTALYVYNPLISLNEVGTGMEPVSPEEFHCFNQERLALWPHSLNATSTHDTKRSEDVRLRLHALSEMPEEWAASLKRWRALNQPQKARLNGQEVPDANDEWFLYQTLLGVWPLDQEDVPNLRERLEEYLIKAVREAKVKSRWIAPNPDYEQALREFAGKILETAPSHEFLADFLKFQQRLAYVGALNSLSQTLLKITSPGVPDFFQGTEVWDFSLVDPDNRRPVDFQKRRALLEGLRNHDAGELRDLLPDLLARWPDGRVKLHLTYKALTCRRERVDLFKTGDYLPLEVAGRHQERVVAFARRLEGQWALVAVPRLMTKLIKTGEPPLVPRVWGDTMLIMPPDAPLTWHNILAGEARQTTRKSSGHALPLAQVMASFPAALLLNATAPEAYRL